MNKGKLEELRKIFGSRLQENVILANYTTARVGGPADCMLVANSKDELEEFVLHLWEVSMPFFILGSGSNVLFSDSGYRGIILLNHARQIRVSVPEKGSPTVYTESGANLTMTVRRTALRSLSGLEWAAGIPGTVGGAVYGNAGAQGKAMQDCLLMAEILHRKDGIPAVETWSKEQMKYQYRSSILKRTQSKDAVILSATSELKYGVREEIQALMKEYLEKRRKKQPALPSNGSMFKNPPGTFAGKLIQEAGLKGTVIGGAQISENHGNFIVNLGHASASDFRQIIRLAQETVEKKFNVKLELEIELAGSWDD